MSAPSLIDQLVAPPTYDHEVGNVTVLARQGRDRRGRDPVSILSRDQDGLCLNAADPLEIAAGLEAIGISDSTARRRYGAATVFDLGQQLYAQVPRRPLAPSSVRRDPWSRPRLELAARGLVYALPGLLLAGAVQHLRIREAVLLLVVSVLGAGLNQSLSYLGHLLIGREQRTGLSRLLRVALMVAAATGVAVAAVARATGLASTPAAVLLLLAAVYLASATVVLILDRHRLLLWLLAPGSLLSLISLASPAPVTAAAALFAAGASVVAAFAAAWWLATQQSDEPLRGVIPVSDIDLRGCLPHTMHGLASIGLLSLLPLAAVHSGGGRAGAGALMLPVVLSLGSAEVQLYAFRRDANRLLTGLDLWAFRARLRRLLARRVLAYAAPLAALTFAIAVYNADTESLGTSTGAELLAYFCLGISLFLASLLVSTGQTRTVAFVEVAAVALAVGAYAVTGVAGSLLQIEVSAALLTAMAIAAFVLLSRAVSHR